MNHRHLFALSIGLLACGGSPAPERAAAPTTAPAPTTPAPAASAPDPAPEPTAVASAEPPPPPKPAPPPECPEGMVKVKGGTYKFGFLKRDETVADLCVDKTEVTATAYEQCVKAGKCTDSYLDCAEAKTYKIPGKENHPIVCVDFPQAKSYCEFAAKRLPTEPEWEWVARAGDQGRKYAYGDDPPKDNVCWTGSSEGTRKGPCAVGSFPASNSPDGIVDLTGNVFEWTSSPADATNAMYVTKGGSWRDGVAAQLVINRPGGFKPAYRCGFGGMRCVAPAKP